METITRYPKEITDQLAEILCSKDDLSDYRHPFVADGLWIATDGHTLLALPAESVQGQNALNTKKSLSSVLKDTQPVDFTFSLSEWGTMLGPVPDKKSNPAPVRCHECDGEGQVECSECEHIHDCKRCDGSGKIYYKEEKPVYQEFSVGKAMFNGPVLSRIIEGVKILGVGSDIGNITALDTATPMVVKFPENVLFVAMPIRYNIGQVTSLPTR